MSKLNRVFILLGGDIEPRVDYLSKAVALMGEELGNVISSSAVYETEAWGFDSENNFLNMVVEMETDLSAKEFLDGALAIEGRLGRTRNDNGEYSSRTIDIDILYFNSDSIHDEALEVPHPRLHLRKFALVPLAELAPGFIHPVLQRTNSELLENCEDKMQVLEYARQFDGL